MPFHHSAQNITIEDGHILKAELANMDGEWVEAEFDLNDCIGNNNGAFEWGGGGFANSAEEISFELEGDDSVPILRANLWNVEGELVGGDINLAERINNNNGEFTFDGHNQEEEQQEEEPEEEE
ncbi:Cyanovirin-N [Plectosphaerella cucumerina]|uniref:Cyanovirin-N n=1 Tax=Plectosphaerella cucumerina TaxID=40658 RepID=A0A8K0X851_9PEZI|nr:Cyanovirin-N [Plectosphaerella cucumerina]